DRVDCPRVERVLGRAEVRELLAQTARELVGQRDERKPCRLAVVREECALAARLRDRGDPRPARRPATAPEYLERLDELGEVRDPGRADAAAARGDRGARAGDRAGGGGGRAGSRLRAADLEADDGLAGVGEAIERLGERRRTPHRLEEQADGSCALVGGEE